MIKIISFDFDGTLVKNTYPDKVWLEGLPLIFSREKNIKFSEAKEFIFNEYDKVGEYQKEWYDINWWFNKFKLKYDWRKLLNDYRCEIKAFSDSHEVLEGLSEKFNLIIISNAKKEFIDIQLDETKLRSYFTHVFSSLSDFNTVKKVPEIYSDICNILKIEPHEMIHIGDHKEFDYESPRKIGIRSIYLDRKKNEKGPYLINNLTDINRIVTNLNKE
jgi:putative hydrolase of the HAD superfamily